MGGTRGERVLSRAVGAAPAELSLVERRVRLLVSIAGAGGAVVSLVGLAVITGWAFGQPVLTRMTSEGTTVKLSTAVCLVGVGCATTLMTCAELTGSVRIRRLAVAVAALVGLLALVTLIEDLTGLTAPFDNPFALDPGDAYTSVAGRMPPMTAARLVGLSVALALIAG